MPSPQPSAVLIKTSLVDFPARVAAACFLRGCNLRCPYCYNTELVVPKDTAISQDLNAGNQNFSQDLNAGARRTDGQPVFVPIQDVIAHLKKRANVLSGFAISGGEPLLQPELVRRLILEARSLGYKIKLDTNGMFPDRLQKLLDDSAARPDYVALDVKTSPARYGELQAHNAGGDNRSQAKEAAQKIVDSIKIVSNLAADAREFRTVLYPPLVARAEVEEIAALLPKDASWFFANFLNGRCLSAAAQNVAPYSDEETAALVDLARATISGASLR